MQHDSAKPIRPAATILIVRDFVGKVEVMTLQRSLSMRFLPGFLSFPGGSLQDDDWQFARQGTIGCVIASEQDDDTTYAVAAIRETGEEIGFLPAVTNAVGRSVNGRISISEQSALLRNEKSLAETLAKANWRLDLGQVRYVGRWITPAHMPARFDTRFFLVDGAFLEEPLSVHESENAWAKWCNPEELLAAVCDGREKAVPPTIAMLKALSVAPNVKWCFEGLSVPQPILQQEPHLPE